MRRISVLGAACALGLTATLSAQRPGGTAPPPVPPASAPPGKSPVGVGPQGPVTPPPSPAAPTPAPVPRPGGPGTNPATGGPLPPPSGTPTPGTPVTGGPTTPAPGTPATGRPGTPGTTPAAPGTAPATGTPASGSGSGTTGTAPSGTSGATAGAATAAPDAGVSSAPFGPAVYLREDVAKALGLSEYQRSELGVMNRKVRQRFLSTVPAWETLPAAERASRRQELERAYRQDLLTGAREVLTPEQLARYQQLEYQAGGFTTLTDPAVQKALGLTEAQQRALPAEVEWAAGQERAVGAADRAEGARLFAAYQKALRERFDRFLTDDQRSIWQRIAGESFPFRQEASAFADAFPATGGSPPKR